MFSTWGHYQPLIKKQDPQLRLDFLMVFFQEFYQTVSHIYSAHKGVLNQSIIDDSACKQKKFLNTDDLEGKLNFLDRNYWGVVRLQETLIICSSIKSPYPKINLFSCNCKEYGCNLQDTFRLTGQWGRLQYTLLMRLNKVETVVQWFYKSRASFCRIFLIW